MEFQRFRGQRFPREPVQVEVEPLARTEGLPIQMRGTEDERTGLVVQPAGSRTRRPEDASVCFRRVKGGAERATQEVPGLAGWKTQRLPRREVKPDSEKVEGRSLSLLAGPGQKFSFAPTWILRE